MNAQDQKRIEELEAEIAKIHSQSARNELVASVKAGKDDDALYLVAKSFTNYVEKIRRNKILEEARAVRDKNKDKPQVEAPIKA